MIGVEGLGFTRFRDKGSRVRVEYTGLNNWDNNNKEEPRNLLAQQATEIQG